MRSFTNQLAALLCGAIVGFAALPCQAGLTSGTLTLATNTSDSSEDTVNALVAPGTYNFGDSVSGSSFIDTYIISVPASGVDALTTSLTSFGNIGISGLDVRLLSFTPGPGVALPLATPPSGYTVVMGWTQLVASSGNTIVYQNLLLDPDALAGDYVLQIQGAPLSGGGSYAGVVNLSPVPLPASLPLILAGAVMLWWFVGRRQTGPGRFRFG